MASAEEHDPSARFQMRFSIRRFENAMNGLSPKQRGFLVKHGFDRFLNLKHQAVFPLPLMDFVMQNMVPTLSIFQYDKKRINFNKSMAQQFLGIYSGIIFFA